MKKKTKSVRFTADPELLRLLSALKKFYRLTTRNKLFEPLILFAVADVAVLPKDSSWTLKQKEAWQVCQQAAKELRECIVLQLLKEMLAEAKNKSQNTSGDV